MAKRIKAMGAFRPRLKLTRTAQIEEVIAFVSRATGLTTGQVHLVLMELQETVAFYGQRGCGVRLEGLGIYLPKIRLDGTIDVEHRLDPKLRRALNADRFTGKIVNAENIGKSGDELIALWNEAHPDDPAETE